MARKSPLQIKEEDIQRTVVEGLEALGFVVLVTSRRRKQCLQCGATDTRGDGVSEGVPDLIVTHYSWRDYAWMGIEMKGPETKLSAEQKILSGGKRIFVCRSWDEALIAVYNAWCALSANVSMPASLRGLASQAMQRRMETNTHA